MPSYSHLLNTSSRWLCRAPGLDNLLYSADADFSCFADLALTSPGSYYKEGQGSLMQCVLTPGDKWMPATTENIAQATLEQVKKLFPSAENLQATASPFFTPDLP